MNILHVASEYPPQEIFGLGRYVSELSHELVRTGHDVHVLTNSIGTSIQDIVDHGVSVHRVDFPPPPKPPGPLAPALAFNLHLIQRAMRLGQSGLGHPEVIVSHDWLTATASHQLATYWGIPHIWTVHDTHRGKHFEHLQEPSDQMTVALELWTATHADLIVVNSVSVGQEIVREGGDESLIRVIPCGIDPDRFVSSLDLARRSAFRLSFAEPDEFLITYAGRLDLEKGIDTLINAVASLRKKHNHIRLALAGKGILEDTIRAHIRDIGGEPYIRLTGYLHGTVLRSFYAVSDLHICPSLYEPFGLVAIEAMAAGAPVIVSDVGGLADIVSSAQVGIRVQPKDVPGLIAAMDRLCSDVDDRHRLGAAGQAHIRSQYSWSRIARLAVDAYQEAVTNSIAVSVPTLSPVASAP